MILQNGKIWCIIVACRCAQNILINKTSKVRILLCQDPEEEQEEAAEVADLEAAALAEAEASAAEVADSEVEVADSVGLIITTITAPIITVDSGDPDAITTVEADASAA